MAEPEIKAGDTVRLKSGGPLMTVSNTSNQDGEPRATVTWFDSKQEAKHASYAIIVLKKDEDAFVV